MMIHATLSRRTKLVVIIHLCFAFTYLSYLLLKPLLDDIFATKGKLDLIESVFQEKDLFSALPESSSQEIIQAARKIETQKRHYLSSLTHLLSKECSTICLGWLFFSVAISLALIFCLNGAKESAYLLPLLILIYGITLSFTEKPSPQKTLYPSEEEVLNGYSSHDSKKFFNKKVELERAWSYYLVTEWAKESPSENKEIFKEQLRTGIFAFNLERTRRLIRGEEIISTNTYFRNRPSFFLWLFYLIWNSFFATYVSRKERIRDAQATL